MGLLNHLFGSTESLAKEIEADDKLIIKHWKNYLKTISKKEVFIERAVSGGDALNSNIKKILQDLKKLLNLELVDVSTEEKEESELISDLEVLEHSKKIRRVQRLEHCLGYAETKYEYIHGLLSHLYSILNYEIQLVSLLLNNPNHHLKLINHLKSQLELELEIINKIKKIKTFSSLFLALISGEHIIKTLDAKEKRLLKKMQKGISKIFSNEIKEGITREWAMAVFNAIEDKVHEGVADGMFDGYHPDIDFEFTNRLEFVDLVREKIQELSPRNVSEQMINVFVHLFREWYNHERD